MSQNKHSNIPYCNSNAISSTDVICFFNELLSYSKQLDSIENSLNTFKYENMDLNKFWLKYFGVVNLSDQKCTFVTITGKNSV